MKVMKMLLQSLTSSDPKQMIEVQTMAKLSITQMIASLMLTSLFIGSLLLSNAHPLQAQLYPASPANWMFPDGNSQATKNQSYRSGMQSPEGFIVKWTTPSISGDVQPLIGNVVNNERILPEFPWAPNEIVAVVANKLVVVNANGTTRKMTNLPPFVKSASVLFDTLQTQVVSHSSVPCVIGLETSEHQSLQDSLAFSYVAGHDKLADTVAILKRLAIDLRIFDPNIFASIKPVYGRASGAEILIYCTVNMSQPTLETANPNLEPFFRGFTKFSTGTLLSNYPLPDFGDDLDSRVMLGPEVSFAQPSMSLLANRKSALLLPNYRTPGYLEEIKNPVTLLSTFADLTYLIGLDITQSQVGEEITPLDLTSLFPVDARPQVRPYYLHLTDAMSPDSIFILVAEEYRGVEGSNGTSRLHLFNSIGDPLTDSKNALKIPFAGYKDHLWSVAVGNLDGTPDNAWLPYYPNNPGKEIIVTQSSRDFSVANNRLTILRYRSGSAVEKPSPPNTFLRAFDTICTQRINGWVAAVNDIDGAANQKEEIFLVDGATLRILRLKDYNEFDFRIGKPFDTVAVFNFPTQTISNVAIADLEGDGLNEIIVTTFDSTFVIGSPIKNTIVAQSPIVFQKPPMELCAGDTLPIVWINRLRTSGGVDITFAETNESGTQTSDMITILANHPNDADTVTYNYFVDEKVIGKTGRFFIRNSSAPDIVFDTTTVVRFNVPFIDLDSLRNRIFTAGSEIRIAGTAFCVDSVAVEYRYDTLAWTRIATEAVRESGSFQIIQSIPCLPFFNCTGLDSDSVMFIQVISYRYDFADTTNSIPIIVKPAKLNVEFDTNMTACPKKEFRWDPNEFIFDCDNLSLYYSIDGGTNFAFIDEVPAESMSYLWTVPLSLPDTVVLRFCCDGACMRTDTLLTGASVRYVSIIAPNPFSPPLQEVEIVYQVPVETKVNIKVLDQANRIVAEPARGLDRMPGFAYCDRWNGMRWDGSAVDNGMYYIMLEFSNGVKEVYPVFVKK